MTPPSFKGESDPLLAESWMRETEKIFRAIRCPDEDKVTLATYMLQVCFGYACMLFVKLEIVGWCLSRCITGES